VRVIETSRFRLAATLAGLGLAVSLTLVGCSGSPLSGGGTGGDGQSGSGSDSQTDEGGSSPGDIDLGDLQGVPETFPDDVPIVDGDVPIGVDLGTGWSVVVQVDDYAASYAEGSTLLTGAGFTALQESSDDSTAFGVFDSPDYQVQLTATDSADYGPSLTYVVVSKE
jgi:hypothetical protein